MKWQTKDKQKVDAQSNAPGCVRMKEAISQPKTDEVTQKASQEDTNAKQKAYDYHDFLWCLERGSFLSVLFLCVEGVLLMEFFSFTKPFSSFSWV